MKIYPALLSESSQEKGSALIITLSGLALITALTVSFLSTSKIEVQATQNQSNKQTLNGFTQQATQQAIKSIEAAFNAPPSSSLSGNYASVITTQPGLITKSFFQNGSLRPSATVQKDLFSSSSELVNLNNLASPFPAALATGVTHSITGNPTAEQLLVGLEAINNGSANAKNAKIAYYVDDESSKVNLNALTPLRATINPAMEKTMSASVLTSNGSAIGSFTLGQSSSGIGRLFSTAQAMDGLGLSEDEVAQSSLAPLSQYHNKYTPWGTEKVFINDLPIDETGVDAIYEALSGRNATTGGVSTDPNKYELTGQKLREIYGTTFAEKYTDAGLKQIAANILQARDPNLLNDWVKSFTYNGSLLGSSGPASDSTTGLEAIADCCNDVKKVIPKDYMGNAPYPFINEIGVTMVWTCEFAGGRFIARPQLRPFITILNPYRIGINASEVSNWEVEMQVDSVRFDVSHVDGSGNSYTFTYGPTGYENNDSWGHSWNECLTNARARDSGRPAGKFAESYLGGWGIWSYRLGGSSIYGGGQSYTTASNRAPNWGSTLGWSQERQFQCPPYPNTNWNNCVQLNIPRDGTQITDISNIRIRFEYIRLLAKAGDDTSIRDWVLAEDLEIEGWLQDKRVVGNALLDGHPSHSVANSYLDGYPADLEKQIHGGSSGPKTLPISRGQTLPPPITYKRIDGRLKSSISGVAAQRDSMKPWSAGTAESWIDDDNGETATQGYSANKYNSEAYPVETKTNDIPGDPTQSDERLFFAYDPSWHHLNSFWPRFQFTNPSDASGALISDENQRPGVFVSPGDLGKIHTNVQHRKLRMMTQHPNEVHSVHGGNGNATTAPDTSEPLSYIPDWAILDVLSLGSDKVSANNTYSASAPINLNTRFHVPGGSPVPVARTTGLRSMLKALDDQTSIGNAFNYSTSTNIDFGNTPDRTYHDPSPTLSDTLSGNIASLAWTSGNYQTSGFATWGHDTTPSSAPFSRRIQMGFPADQLILPSEVTEISGVSDSRTMDRWGQPNIKGNEGRLGALFPGATTQSRFFTIYAYAQSLDKNGNVDAEQVTKTLVEVENHPGSGNNPFNPPKYKVKKLLEETIY